MPSWAGSGHNPAQSAQPETSNAQDLVCATAVTADFAAVAGDAQMLISKVDHKCVFDLILIVQTSISGLFEISARCAGSCCPPRVLVMPLAFSIGIELSAYCLKAWVPCSGMTAPQLHNTLCKPSNAPHSSGFNTQLLPLGTTLSDQDIGSLLCCCDVLHSDQQCNSKPGTVMLQASSAWFGIWCR